MEFGFVVLHYLAYDMTVRCTEALLALSCPVHIVIVDNASPGGSGARLQEHFAGNPSVTVLQNGRNEGFARGNNVGYNYLKAHFSCSFIAVINNDVLIPDPAFCDKVAAIYAATPFAVLGPDILNPNNGTHQNPAHLQGFTQEQVRQRLQRYRKNLHPFWWNRLKWRIKQLFSPTPAPAPKPLLPQPMENVVLHGACYVFSQDFIRTREYCFNPATFLYFEEDILHRECMQKGLTLRYDPSVQVLHLENVSTDQAFRSSDRKERLILQESVRSMQVFLDITAP